MNQIAGHLECIDHELRIVRRTIERVSEQLKSVMTDLGCHRKVADHVELTASPCDNCPQRDACSEPCEKLLAFLPSEDAGRNVRITRSGMPLDEAQHDRGRSRADHRDLFDRYQACRAWLTAKQWEAIECVHGKGMSQRQAAEILGKAESTISERLAQARQAMLAFHSSQERRLSVDTTTGQ
jgi:hypothetical protein